MLSFLITIAYLIGGIAGFMFICVALAMILEGFGDHDE